MGNSSLPIWGYTWYVIYFPVFTPNILMTAACLVYLLTQKDSFPLSLRIWLVPKALSDIVAVLFNGCRLILALSAPSLRLPAHSVTECRLLFISRSAVEVMSTFLQAGMCIERALCVAFPLHRRARVTVKWTVVAVVFVVSYSFGVTTVFAVLGFTGFDPNHPPEVTGCENNLRLTPIFASFEVYAHRLMPTAVFVVTSLVLVHAIVSNWRRRKEPTPTAVEHPDAMLSAKEVRLCASLVMLNVVYLACALPNTGWTMATEAAKRRGDAYNGYDFSTYIIVTDVLLLNDFVDNALNWALYCGVSAHFREWASRRVWCWTTQR